MSTNKCVGLIIVFSLLNCGFIEIQLQAAPSDTQNSKSNTVSMTWCVSQIEKVAKTENDCRRELSKTRIELEKSKGKQNGLTEKIGVFALGCGVAVTNFNPLAIVAAGWLIVFN